MRWKGRRRSTNVTDGRSSGGRRRGGKMALGGIGTIIVIVIALLMGENPINLLLQTAGDGGFTQTQQSSNYQPSAEEQELFEFIQVVMADTEDVWNKLYREQGATYDEPQLMVFNGSVRSGCGAASAATGPFYCSADKSAYVDLSFYNELSNRFGAPGDFAMAYVIAHEVGHHVQYLMGTSTKVHQARSRVSEEEYNKLSVKLELQADFFAGVWAHHAQKMHNILEQGDIEEALTAANAIGDDRLQKQAQGYVVPDSFTHGSSEQRVRWFKKGFETGDISQGDTFNAAYL